LEQLDAAVAAVFESWRSEHAIEYRRLNDLPDTLGTAVTVQRMVFGNAGCASGSGVAFTRDPATGENRLYIDFLFNSQGEDVVSGRHAAGDAERLAAVLPAVQTQLLAVAKALENAYQDAQEFEFTLQDGELFVLQTRTGKRTPWAALRIAVDQVHEGLIDVATGLTRLEGVDIDKLERRHLADSSAVMALARATPAGLGTAGGAIALDVDTARRYASEGKATLLVREDIATADIAGLAVCDGLLTTRGSRTAHAAVVARQLGKPCLVACEQLKINLTTRRIALGDKELAEGDTLWMDAGSGLLFAHEPQVIVERPNAELATVAAWRTGV